VWLWLRYRTRGTSLVCVVSTDVGISGLHHHVGWHSRDTAARVYPVEC